MTNTSEASSHATGVLLCADIKHSQGASEYALLSFLRFALRMRSELPREHILGVQMPEGIDGLHLGMLFTPHSLAELSNQTGIEWRTSPTCDYRSFDVRVGDRVRLGSALQQKLKHSPWNSSAALPHYDMKRRSYPAAYYQVVIQYLIDILRVMRGRQPGFYLLRCSLVLIQARLTPLVHAALPFHEQAMKIVRTLDFSQGRSATSGEAASADSGVRSPQHGDARTCMYPIGCS